MEHDGLSDLIDSALRLLMLAQEHQGMSVCFNPHHNHAGSPCDDDCVDHNHQCNHGCGEWPCDFISYGDQVASSLQDVFIVKAAMDRASQLLDDAVYQLDYKLNHKD